MFYCFHAIVHNCWSNYQVLFVFYLYMINWFVETYPLFGKFSKNNLHALQESEKLSAYKLVNTRNLYTNDLLR